MTALVASLIAASYLLGSIPFAYLIGRAYGVDISQAGSGNIGATNVVRTIGKWQGYTCFLLDFLKGAGPIWLATSCGLSRWSLVAIAIAAILGHSKSVFLRFKGGKSVATGSGTIVAMSPIVGMTGFAVWLILFFASRIVSLASIGAAVAIPVAMWAFKVPFEFELFGLFAAGYVIVRHRGNIQRLLTGTEPGQHRVASASRPITPSEETLPHQGPEAQQELKHPHD